MFAPLREKVFCQGRLFDAGNPDVAEHYHGLTATGPALNVEQSQLRAVVHSHIEAANLDDADGILAAYLRTQQRRERLLRAIEVEVAQDGHSSPAGVVGRCAGCLVLEGAAAPSGARGGPCQRYPSRNGHAVIIA